MNIFFSYYYSPCRIIFLGCIPHSGITKLEKFKGFARCFKDFLKTLQTFPMLLDLSFSLVWVNCHLSPQLLPNPLSFMGTLPHPPSPQRTQRIWLLSKSHPSEINPVGPPNQWTPLWSKNDSATPSPICQQVGWGRGPLNWNGKLLDNTSLIFLPLPHWVCLLSHCHGNPISRLIAIPWRLEEKTQLTDKQERRRKEDASPRWPSEPWQMGTDN